MLILPFYRLAAWLVPYIPPALGYRLCDRVGDLIFGFNLSARAAVMSNQRHVLGVEALQIEVEAKARQVFRCLIRNYFDQFRLGQLQAEDLERHVTVQGIEYVDQALAGGKGLIIVTAHFGAPEVVGQVLAIRGYPTTIVVEHIRPEAVFELMTRLRASKGIQIIPIDRPLIGLFRALRRNTIVGLVGDRDISQSGIWLPFFGDETRVADGAVQLALRTGAPVMVAFCRRLPNNRFYARGQPPFHVIATGNFAEDVRVGTEHLMRELESFIRAWPEQWVMSVPLWRRWETPE
ncbi:MAG: lysophospholipid acyltransferase family protein [Ardenticatenaceae bacterium]|nr:lysophospholipid acyltransferase family protein [Ardenticatenaceae bacterium]